MYSNLMKYVPNRKPPMGAVLNPYLPINRGIAGYWPMWSGAGNKVFDLSGNGHVGTFVGSPTWGSGLYGSVIDWNGNTNSINCGNLGHPSAFTLITWIKIISIESSYNTIMGRGNAFTNNCSYWFVYRTSSGNELLCWSRDGAGNLNKLQATGTPLTLNQWQMVAVTWGDGISGALYIDGKSLTLSVQQAYNGTDGGYNTYLGKLGAPSWSGMVGSMSHVLIYNRALNASEIAEVRLEPFCGFRWPNIIELASYVAVAPSGIPIFRRRRAG